MELVRGSDSEKWYMIPRPEEVGAQIERRIDESAAERRARGLLLIGSRTKATIGNDEKKGRP